ncbi:hypothetical protein [Streptomyces sp. YKOK-I1]
MRHTTTLLAVLLLAGAAVGCTSGGDTAGDCAAVLAERVGGDAADKPTVAEAKERVDALDDALAGMVRSGYEGVANNAFDAVDKKAKEGGTGRPEACGALNEDDYTALQMATAIDGLGWTGDDGKFDKLKMVESLGN